MVTTTNMALPYVPIISVNSHSSFFDKDQTIYFTLHYITLHYKLFKVA